MSLEDYLLYAYGKERNSQAGDNDKFGVELELENFRIGSRMQDQLNSVGWRIVHDGSLRGAFAAELVSNPPFRTIDELEKGLEVLPNNLGSYRSHRTSTHIHINCEDLEVQELALFWSLCVLYESIFTDFYSPTRKHNNFARPLLYIGPAYNVFQRKEYDDFQQLNNAVSMLPRYSAVTPFNLFNAEKQRWPYGTIEWRCFDLPADPNQVKHMVSSILELKALAKNLAAEGLSTVVLLQQSIDNPFWALEGFLEVDLPDAYSFAFEKALTHHVIGALTVGAMASFNRETPRHRVSHDDVAIDEMLIQLRTASSPVRLPLFPPVYHDTLDEEEEDFYDEDYELGA